MGGARFWQRRAGKTRGNGWEGCSRAAPVRPFVFAGLADPPTPFVIDKPPGGSPGGLVRISRPSLFRPIDRDGKSMERLMDTFFPASATGPIPLAPLVSGKPMAGSFARIRPHLGLCRIHLAGQGHWPAGGFALRNSPHLPLAPFGPASRRKGSFARIRPSLPSEEFRALPCRPRADFSANPPPPGDTISAIPARGGAARRAGKYENEFLKNSINSDKFTGFFCKFPANFEGKCGQMRGIARVRCAQMRADAGAKSGSDGRIPPTHRGAGEFCHEPRFLE